MNCDQVFAVLTSGPFPTGAVTDAAVERHLDRCTSCWRIAEALRPAHDMFEESVPTSEGHLLPGYWGDATGSRTAHAYVQQTALRTATQPRPARLPVRSMPYVPYAVADAIGWRDVARIGSFLILMTSTAFAVAWMWR